jgi:hypothetical protein
MDSAKETPKQEWERPQLIALMRSRPEEAVLAACKTTGRAGAVASNNNCYAGPSWRCGTTSCSTNRPS